MPTRLRSLVTASAVALGLLVTAAPAHAVADPTLNLENFDLRPNSLGTELKDRVAKLDTELTKAGVGKIMADANRKGTIGKPYTPCNSAASQPQLSTVDRSICFTSGDNSTGLWTPQGVTTVADAQDDQHWGEKNQPVLISWYDSSAKDGVDDEEDEYEKGVRVTFLDPATGVYRHVLLVYPTINSYGNPSYMSLRYKQTGDGKSLHAGGMVWYGNFLYVADTDRGFRVFDMRHIYDLGAAENGTTEDPSEIGRRSGTYYGHGYRYVMPQVASWTVTSAKGDECTPQDVAPSFSYASLDRSGTDHIIAGEYCDGTDEAVTSNGRVAAWAIADSLDGDKEQITDPDYRWQADAAHKLPITNVQGATRFNDRWYLSQSLGGSTNGALVQTTKTDFSDEELTAETRQPAAIGPEDLSHWQTGQGGTTLGAMWTVAEHPNKRMVYSTVPEAVAD
ncbi:hypothetical protein ABT324_13315 [Saccharopolyspora sp. NPDC000359]|uniref:hypothetical protein n=1 Tax=Saccharopolyspora sp. NPDC000359 TaxID=3154251 RepID=UPI00331EC26F